ncbi:MAG TPA: hypothetical protein VFD06_16105 [Candidatus Polarisedimenticolia bacterium]|nr:hypothetical protein [Candidatus Polarisedimenticolia bacterium]
MGTVLFVLGVLLFFGVVAFFIALISIPILLVIGLAVAAIRFAFFLLTLPFRLVGWMFGLAVGR